MVIEFVEDDNPQKSGPQSKPLTVSDLYQGIIERAGKARAELAEKLQVPAMWPEILTAVSSLCAELEQLRTESSDIRGCDKCDLCEDHHE